MPEGDTWCRIVTSDELDTLLGDADRERVRQVGDFGPDEGPGQQCDIFWADGEEPVNVVSGATRLVRGGELYRSELAGLRDFLGAGGERLANGDVEELAPGIYLEVGDQSIAVFQGCETGGSVPAIMSANLYFDPTETGEQLEPDQIVSLGERLTEKMVDAFECTGEVRPLGAEDWEPLAADAASS